MEAANWSMIATKYPINQSARFDLWPDHWVELPNWSWCRCSNKIAIHCTVPFPMAPRSSDLPGAIHDHYALYQRTRDLGDLTICDLRSMETGTGTRACRSRIRDPLHKSQKILWLSVGITHIQLGGSVQFGSVLFGQVTCVTGAPSAFQL